MKLSTCYPPATKGKIIVWGFLASSPFGGIVWQTLHYLAGLRRLGFDVWYVEESDRPLYDPVTYSPTYEYAANARFLSEQMESIGLGDRWAFRPPGKNDELVGAEHLRSLPDVYGGAD